MGFFGVDLENLLNEVVFVVVCFDKKEIDMSDFDEVSDCVIVGLVKKNWVIFEKECCIVVYYEGGYVIVGMVFDEVEVVYKVIIVFCG